ncbi:MAG: hypothetical protein PGN13_16330 [Patulibacter minatonensis]
MPLSSVFPSGGSPEVVAVMIGDGRYEYHDKAATSLASSGVLARAGHVVQIDDRDHVLGFRGAMALAWRLAAATGAKWVFHAELDFTYPAPVPLDDMIAVLDENPHLSQMSLKRQPVNAEERAAGGIVELSPDEYLQFGDGRGYRWIETTRFSFTCNPSVYRAELCELGWPDAEHSEGLFSARLRGQGLRTGIWGELYDEPRTIHIGDVRAGTGY